MCAGLGGAPYPAACGSAPLVNVGAAIAGARVSLKSLTDPKGFRQAGMVTVYLVITGCTYTTAFLIAVALCEAAAI
jgi:hypothetical protein